MIPIVLGAMERENISPKAIVLCCQPTSKGGDQSYHPLIMGTLANTVVAAHGWMAFEWQIHGCESFAIAGSCLPRSTLYLRE